MADQQERSSRTVLTGYVLAIVQAVFYATMGIFGKLLYATGLTAQEAIILRFLATTVILGTVLLIWRKHALVSRQPAVYVQALLFFLSAILYFFAIERMSAGVATVIFYLYPVVVAVLSLFVFHERLSAPTAIALGIAVGGLLLVSGVIESVLVIDMVGIALAVAASLAFAVYTMLIQKMGRTESPFTITFTLSWMSLLASCLLFAPSVPTMFHLSVEQIVLGCLTALFNTILGSALYIMAVKKIGATKTSLIGISETPFSLLFAYLILGETLTALQGIGAVLIVVAIVIVTVVPAKKVKG